MKSIADHLPPEIAQQIHPDWRKNEAEYWAVRDQLLNQYQGQWIGFADGIVIASGASAVQVLHAAQQSRRHPFFICVGREEEPCRIRRITFPYDTGYPFQIWACLDGQDYKCRLQPDFVGSERILGRDVLNQLDILFRGIVGEVIVNP